MCWISGLGNLTESKPPSVHDGTRKAPPGRGLAATRDGRFLLGEQVAWRVRINARENFRLETR